MLHHFGIGLWRANIRSSTTVADIRIVCNARLSLGVDVFVAKSTRPLRSFGLEAASGSAERADSGFLARSGRERAF
jgi:hypothetical protein